MNNYEKLSYKVNRQKRQLRRQLKKINNYKQENQQLKSVLNEVREIIETKFLETELYGGELVCIAVENYKKIKTMLDKGSDK